MDASKCFGIEADAFCDRLMSLSLTFLIASTLIPLRRSGPAHKTANAARYRALLDAPAKVILDGPPPTTGDNPPRIHMLD